MKLSIVRTDKKNIPHLTVKSIEWFLERIKTDTKAEDIGRFRHYIARFGDTGQYEDNVPMAMIHPLVEMTKTENGNLEITAFNSLTWLHVSGLMKPEEIKLDVSEKRSTLQAMHNFLLINLDEFNSISPKLQEGFLKNVIQLPNVKIKRPYGKHVEEFKRYASFIATTNETNVLSDPSGSRRFICVNLTAPIKTDYKPNYEGLYGQAYRMVVKKEMDWWFSAEEVKEIMDHNRQYQLTPPAIQYFNEYYLPAADETDGKWLSPTAIYDQLRQIAGSGLKANGVSTFGRFLWNMPELQHRRVGSSKQYLVKKKG